MDWLKKLFEWLASLFGTAPPNPAPQPPPVNPGGGASPPIEPGNPGPPVPDAGGERDAIPLELVTWLHPSAGAFRVTAGLAGVDISRGAKGTTIAWSWRHPIWPEWSAGPGQAVVVANLWCFRKGKDGRWFAATIEWLRTDTTRMVLQAKGDEAPFIQAKASGFDAWFPLPGEEVGFMISTICRGGYKPEGAPRERTPIVLVRWK